MKTNGAIRRSGRVLSAKNKAELEKGIGHLEKAIALMREVLDSNGEQTAIENSWKHAPLH